MATPMLRGLAGRAGGRDLRSALLRLGALVVVAASALACGGPDPVHGPDDDPLARGIAAFEDYYFYDAKEAFAEALRRQPDDPEAAHAYARTLLILHEYEDAIPALGSAIRIAPDDPRLHAAWVRALTWGGIFRGRRDWFDQAIEAASGGLIRFPDLVSIYQDLDVLAQEAQATDQVLALLDSLEPRIGSSPVFRVHRLAAALNAAGTRADEAGQAAVRDQLRRLAEEYRPADPPDGTEPQEDSATDLTAPRAYAIMRVHRLLEDSDEAARWLDRLEELPGGASLAADDRHFGYFSRLMALREDPDAQWQLLQEWSDRFPTTWASEDFQRGGVPLGRQLSEYRLELMRRNGSGGNALPPGPALLTALSERELVDRVVHMTLRAARLNTTGGAATYIFTARELLALGGYEEDVLRLIDVAQERIAAGESMVYPGSTAAERAEEERNLRAAFLLLRGQVMDAMVQPDAAEPLLREALAVAPRADRYEALGRFLSRQDRQDEAYEALVAALGWNRQSERIRDAGSVRELAAGMLAARGLPADRLDADIEAAAMRAAEISRAAIVDDRLDLPAPDFALADLDGRQWRLSELRGKVVVLNYWATWCGPCRAEAPHYQQLVDDFAGEEDVVFLAISTDTDRAAVFDFVQELGLDYRILFDQGSSTDFHVTGIPQHIFIGPEGRVQYRPTGFGGPERYVTQMRWRIEALRTPAAGAPR